MKNMNTNKYQKILDEMIYKNTKQVFDYWIREKKKQNLEKLRKKL
jgi:hypothetical protein